MFVHLWNKKILHLTLLTFLTILLIGCQTEGVTVEPPEITVAISPTNQPSEDGAYPSPLTTATLPQGYPESDASQNNGNYLAEPPNPERQLPEASAESAVIGGVLLQEEPGLGYIPLIPLKFLLGKVLFTDSGEPAYIRTGGDSSSAELFDTGIFVFHAVEPGEYGLVVDLGFTQFPILNEDGTPRTINVTSGQVLDLGQVITQIPTS
jgi:hypothetical protein